jgi:hypothetical protein
MIRTARVGFHPDAAWPQKENLVLTIAVFFPI